MQSGFSKTSLLAVVVLTVAVITGIIVILREVLVKEESEPNKAFIYDINELRKTDPALVKYKESVKIDTGLNDVYAIAVDSYDRIYVAGDKFIRIFSNKGEHLSDIELNEPAQCLTIADDGKIYVGMKEHVEIYSPDGKSDAVWESLGQSAIITSIAVSGDNVFVADASGRVVVRYDKSGEMMNLIGRKDTAKGISGFVVPSPYFDLTVAEDGLLRVVNPGFHRIEAYTFDGDLEFAWGETSTRIDGFSGCCNPVNFAILPDGKFVTSEKGLTRVKVYNADGTFDGVVAGSELFPVNDGIYKPEDENKGLDVATDSKGRVLVLDPAVKAVRIFTYISNQERIER